MGDTGAATITIPRARELVADLFSDDNAAELFLIGIAQRDTHAYADAFEEARRGIMHQYGDCMQRSGLNAHSIYICEADRAKHLGEVNEKLIKQFGHPSTAANCVSEYDLLVPFEDVEGMTRQSYHVALSRLHDEFTRLLSGRVESQGK